MNGAKSILFCEVVIATAAVIGTAAEVQAVDSGAVKELFLNPPREYATAPLWVWNDMLTEEQVRSTLRDLASQGVKQAFVHPRPGLMTPYLGDEWFRLWGIALDEARKLDMNLWIYDENSYPSGFAGGHVPEQMPQSRGQGISFKRRQEAPAELDNVVGVFLKEAIGYRNVTDDIRKGRDLGDGSYLVVERTYADRAGWHGGWFYVDLTRPGVTEKFLEITLEPYRQRFGDEFGKRIPGSFTDEPHLKPTGNLHWTDDIEEAFKARWAYSLVDNLPGLIQPVGDFKRVRHNYYQLLLELFIERWAKPYYLYCEKNNLEFTGHYWEHEWPNCTSAPDNMAMYAWHQRPAIDCLMNNYAEHANAQFGNIRAVKELSSIANQLGKERTLCEAYGAGGWDLRFEDMKRIGDWLYVLGINTLDEHLSYITLRGARKRDHPQSFSYHEPWWQDYHVMANYFARLSAALSAGEQVNRILVIEPTTTAWMYQFDPTHKQHLEAIGARFQKLVTDLSKKQVEFDVGCENVMAGYGSANDRELTVEKRSYSAVVLPPMTETLNAETMELLEAYCKAGGKLFCCGDPPALVEAVESERGSALTKTSGYRQVDEAALAEVLLADAADGFAITAEPGSEGLLLHHRRILSDAELLFITNTSISKAVKGTIVSPKKGLEQWDIESGAVTHYAFDKTDTGIRAEFELAPAGSLLLLLSDEETKTTQTSDGTEKLIAASAPTKVKRLGPNVLTLDYVDITAGDETRKGLYFYRANRMAFEKNGMEQNPWDSEVQFKDELISKKFPADSGLEATYRFTIEDAVPHDLCIVIERPDLYQITCNGKAVEAKQGQWWLDKAFGRVDIASVAKAGENAVTIKALPFTIYHELESAYVLGSFLLEPAESGFVITPDAPLELGRWNDHGHPFYAEGVSYTQQYDVPEPKGRYLVRLPSWYGSVATVKVNGADAGHIYHQPWQCDVTEHIKAGQNEIEVVVVVGTLKNTLGPHHGNPPLGSAWPTSFQRAPTNGPPAGKKYHTIAYGLFKPFVLVRQ